MLYLFRINFLTNDFFPVLDIEIKHFQVQELYELKMIIYLPNADQNLTLKEYIQPFL